MMTSAPTCADCGAPLETEHAFDALDIDVDCPECGAPHTVHRYTVIEWSSERRNEPATPRASLRELQRRGARRA